MNQFYALQHLPLADMVMISASAPMYTVFFARIFIKVPSMSFYPDFI
jgi:drug/metabolite transporter (DMT)-like permease